MKFISKQSNYNVVLRPGQPGSRMAGILPVPGIHLRFEGGMANLLNEEHIKMAMETDAYKNGDFIVSPEDKKDPYLASRKNIEPEHNISEMEHGSVGKAINPKPLVEISEMQKEAIAKMAKEMATSMYEKMVKEKEEEEKKVEAAKEEVVKEEAVGPTQSIKEKILEAEQVETIKAPVATFKRPSVTAPLPIEDTSFLGGEISTETLEPMQVERMDVKDVKIEVDGNESEAPLIKIKHTPNAPKRSSK